MISHVDALYSSYDGKVPEAQLKAARALDAEMARRIRGHGEQLYHTVENLIDRLRQVGGRENEAAVHEARQVLLDAAASGEAEPTVEGEMLTALHAAEAALLLADEEMDGAGISSALALVRRAIARACGA